MCGIAGFVSRTETSESERNQVSALIAQLHHRGPDGEGRYSGSQVELAMRRLSIIDLDGGWQPIYNEDNL
jgi:asparagine synthase (glutamine-hydrolysing)